MKHTLFTAPIPSTTERINELDAIIINAILERNNLIAKLPTNKKSPEILIDIRVAPGFGNLLNAISGAKSNAKGANNKINYL